MIYTFENVEILIISEAGEETPFQLQAPNSGEPFSWGYRPGGYLAGRYHDSQGSMQQPYEEYQFFCQLGYDWHQMDTNALLTADTIKLRIPQNFTGDTADYTEHEVILENPEALESWLAGEVIITPEDELSYPRDGLTLSFQGIRPILWWQVLGLEEPAPEPEET